MTDTGTDSRVEADGASVDSDDATDRTADAEVTDDAGATDVAAEPTVSVASLSRRFGDVRVLTDVTFEASPGTVSCFVGPNGSGKTTLLQIIAGILPSSGGTVRVEAPGDRTVGYLPQTPSFRPQFTLAETLEFYGDLAGVDVDPQAALERVGLGEVSDRRVGDLSGGMTRLFGIAQATVGDPPVLVLDEPSSGLDPTMTEHVATVVDELADGDRTVLLATHELGTVERIADTVLVLDGGEIQVAASPAELRRRTDSETLTHAVNEYIVESDGLTVRAGNREGDHD